MNSRERFLETLNNGSPDRVPLFEEGIRSNVISSWSTQTQRPDKDLVHEIPIDRHEEIKFDLEPHPNVFKHISSEKELNLLEQSLNPHDPVRLPHNWERQKKAWQECKHVLMLRVNRGFFQTMGVDDWRRFHQVMEMVMDAPGLVRDIMIVYGRFIADLLRFALEDIEIDAAVFSEPIAGNHGPLISPSTYENLVLPGYRPILEVLKENHANVVIMRSYANFRILIPSILEAGINCLWACECNTDAMDYLDLREEYGPKLQLIGGIDVDALRQGREEIKTEVERVVPPLLSQGGYIPLADGRIRSSFPYENYKYYRQLLLKTVT